MHTHRHTHTSSYTRTRDCGLDSLSLAGGIESSSICTRKSESTQYQVLFCFIKIAHLIRTQKSLLVCSMRIICTYPGTSLCARYFAQSSPIEIPSLCGNTCARIQVGACVTSVSNFMKRLTKYNDSLEPLQLSLHRTYVVIKT